MNCADEFWEGIFPAAQCPWSDAGRAQLQPGMVMVHSTAPLERMSGGGFREALAAGTSLDSAVVFMFMILFDLQHVNVSLNYSFL